jgi:hypothetical protein
MSALDRWQEKELVKKSKTYGVMKKLIGNKPLIPIETQEKIVILMAVPFEPPKKIASWVLIDFAKEYNQSLSDGDCSLMMYTQSGWRGIGLASRLLQNSIPIIGDKNVFVYPNERTTAERLFEAWSKSSGIPTTISDPVYYSSRT